MARIGEQSASSDSSATCRGDSACRAPTLPLSARPARAPVRRRASLAAQVYFIVCNVLICAVAGNACAFVYSYSFVLWTDTTIRAENVVCATWLHVVDMSLSAPAQAVRGTRTNSLDQLDFQERRQLIASSLSLTDFLHVGAKEVAAVAGQFLFFSHTPACIPNKRLAKSHCLLTFGLCLYNDRECSVSILLVDTLMLVHTFVKSCKRN